MGWGEGGPKETKQQVSRAVNSCHRGLRDRAEQVKVCPVSSRGRVRNCVGQAPRALGEARTPKHLP